MRGPYAEHTDVLMLRSRSDSPEGTGTASNVPTSTSSISHSTITPSTSGSGPNSTSAEHHSSDPGPTAGGVIGAIIGAALIVGAVAWLIVRRRRARSAPSTLYLSLHEGEMEQPTPYHLMETPKLYVSVYHFTPATVR